jgi:membrane-bound serine protease (ClpP class)
MSPILKIFIGVILAYVLFELFEHVIIPLAWLILKGKRKQRTGAQALIGEIGEVREWNGNEGRIFVHGSIWAATSDSSLSPGDKTKVSGVEGLVLKIEMFEG